MLWGLEMKRILIIGSNGSGKSTFSFALEEILGLPLVHIDQIYWRDAWEVTPQEEFRQLVLQEAQKDCWIIEGNHIRTLCDRLAFADTLFWFEFAPIVCLWGILCREFRFRGKARPDMPEGCISRLEISFLRYAWSFNRKNRVRIQEALSAAPHVKVIRFTCRRQVEQYIQRLQEETHAQL